MNRKNEVAGVVRSGTGLAILLVLVFPGCQALPNLSSRSVDLVAFEKAGDFQPVVDLEKLTRAQVPVGPYRVVAGDVLEFQLPSIAVSNAPQSSEQFQVCQSRVYPHGVVRLPVVGEIKVVGKTLMDIESATAKAYFPKYLVRPPSVVAKVVDYFSIRVSVVGAVREPGVYDLHSNEKSLVAALLKAGGIVPEGAGQIRIRRGGAEDARAIPLPVKDLNIPFADVGLEDGDVVEVEKFETPVFAVTGLVNKPGAFPCPPGAQYNLMQGLAMAGGVNSIAAPEHARVYRRDADGNVLSMAFRIDERGGGEGSRVMLKPGDVVAVEQTPGTWTRLVIAQMLRFGFGVNASYGINN